MNVADILKNAPVSNLTPEEKAQKMVDYFNNSVGNLNDEDGYNCNDCKNRGYFAKLDAYGNEVRVECKCLHTRNILRRAQKSGLGAKLHEYRFDTYKVIDEWQNALKTASIAFCEDVTANLFYIGGQVGCGKTHLCTAICAYYLKKGFYVKYMLWAEDAKRLKSIANDKTYQNEVAVYKNASVLYIDDFLKVKHGENPTAADINLAFEIINSRLVNERITIISSEKTLDELMQYDEATMSRIYQQAGKYRLTIEKDINKNYRLRG